MSTDNLQALYKDILDKVLNNDVRLPSLPDITMKVRTAIDADNTTCDTLTEIIAKDPALTAYLIQAASSPVYRRAMPPKTLSEVVGLLGFSSTNSLVMLHSTRNMVELKDATAKKLFKHTWERLVVKTSIGSFLAQQLKSAPVDQVQMAMLLTEVGSLTVLSSMLDADSPIDADTYFMMCRQYSKKIGHAVLTKWDVDKDIIKMMNDTGQWKDTWEGKITLVDIANLSLYYTVLFTTANAKLPELQTLAAFQKLPEKFQDCSRPNWLSVITDNADEIKKIASAFK